MPSPFPGMDPYLEYAASWPDVHHHLISSIQEHLAALLSPRYYVRVEERVYITDRDTGEGYGQKVPDLVVTKRVRESETQFAVAFGVPIPISPSVQILGLVEDEVHDYYLVVLDARARKVVTAIELLSPMNKRPGSEGREAMLDKRSAFLQSGASCLEIDLLRAGPRIGALEGRSDYCVTLARPGVHHLRTWFIDLRDHLPVVAVPLKAEDGEAPLDLQAALDVAYDRARYADSVDYGGPVPPPPLKPADAVWAATTLNAWTESKAGQAAAERPS